MDTYNLKPENMRAPANLSREEIQKSLDELDNKIKTLKGRVNATAADSHHTYHEHIAALEAKRELIAQKLGDKEDTESKWQGLKDGLDSIKKDIDNLFK
jgi:chromosome segregation ATPase